MKRYIPIEHVDALVERLQRCPNIAQLSTQEQMEPEALALAVSEIECSILNIIEKITPIIGSKVTSEAQVLDALHEMREELRHIVYHIGDSKFLGVILEPR